jgi:hypothetical protein
MQAATHTHKHTHTILDAKMETLAISRAAKMEVTLRCVRHIGTTLRCIGKSYGIVVLLRFLKNSLH